MKILISGAAYSVEEGDGPAQIVLPVRISAAGKNRWSKVNMIVDSGSSHAVIPRKLLNSLDIEVPSANESQMMDANGNVTQTPVVFVDISLRSIPAGTTINFCGLPAIISEGNTLLLGMMILNQMNMVVKSGQLSLLDFAKA